MRWIRLTPQAIPDPDSRVLVCLKNYNIRIAVYADNLAGTGYTFWDDMEYGQLPTPTHWMPLPPRPGHDGVDLSDF